MFTIEDRSAHNSGRSSLTCLYRCGNACANDAPNCSDNEYFGDMMRAAVSRRSVLRAGAVVGAVGLAGPVLGGGSAAAATRGSSAATAGVKASPTFAPGLDFATVAPNV